MNIKLLVSLLFSVFMLGSVRGKQRFSIIDTDFESGDLFPWFNAVEGNTAWIVENFTDPVEPTQVPEPSDGSQYVRVHRKDFQAGEAILKSPVWTAFPGDELTLEFWMKSVHAGANTIEVFWSADGVEESLLDLNIYSSPANFEWRRVAAPIPVSLPTDIEITIRGFCSHLLEDSVAIDNIKVISTGETKKLQ